jgi:hypothetical protein
MPRLPRADEAHQDDPASRRAAGNLRVLLFAVQAGGDQGADGLQEANRRSSRKREERPDFLGSVRGWGLAGPNSQRGDGDAFRLGFRAARPEGSRNRVVSIPADHPSACGRGGKKGRGASLLLCAPLLYGWFQPGGGTMLRLIKKTRRRPFSLARRTGRDASSGPYLIRPNEVPADACERVAEDIRRRCFCPATTTPRGAHVPIA